MLRVLIIVDYYLPGYKGGGPIRSVANIVASLSDSFEFFVLTRDRDLGDDVPYTDITTNQWIKTEHGTVYYASPDALSFTGLKTILDDLDYDVLLLNSFFSMLSIKIYLLKILNRIRISVLIAPRGEFYSGALRIKPMKKRFYLSIAKILRWYRSVSWIASTKDEADTIRNIFTSAHISIVPNLPPHQTSRIFSDKRKKTGVTRLVFFSRISPKKNLDGALRMLQEIDHPLEFDIYGTLEDADYWEKCQQLMTALPDHITVRYCGVLEPDQVTETLANYHLMFFPTHGENFGHVIWEALYAGVPVLISDQTPWHDLEQKQVGWQVPLSQPERFVEIIEEMSRMDQVAFQAIVRRAHDYAVNISHNEDALEANRRLFIDAVNG